jgi:hypothetical protein
MNLSIRRRPEKVYVTWHVDTIPRKVYDTIVEYVEQSSDYTYNINPLVAKLPDVPVDAINSIRGNAIKAKIIAGYARQAKMLPRLTAEYTRDGILAVATRWDFPPLNLLRNILTASGRYSGRDLKGIFTGSAAPSALSAYDHEQFKLAAANDIMIGDAASAEAAQSAEDTFADKLRELGFSIKTQAELTEEQMRDHGRAVITPDILFTEHVIINGARVHWIDFKNYVATDIKFLKLSNAKQAARYTAQWGPGAICYSYAVEGVKFDGEGAPQVLTRIV